MLMCVANVSYDANADTLGDQTTFLMIASVMLIVAMLLWVLGNYGIVNAMLIAFAVIL